MLRHDPIPWLTARKGAAAVRARRLLGLHREGDADAVQAVERECAAAQSPDGSFAGSPMKTAGMLNLLADLRATGSGAIIDAGAAWLLSVLEAQPGYARAQRVRPGGLRTPCDLCGFFGPYASRNDPAVMKQGAREMNFYREYEPLLGPRAPVRDARRSSLDRPGPGSCYAWGLIPLCYVIEAVCRAGHGRDPRLRPAIHVLLGAQRDSGGWCRNLGGHPSCTIHAVRALGAHPRLRRSRYARRALRLMAGRTKGARRFAFLQAAAAFDLSVAREILRATLAEIAPTQRRNGTFGTPCAAERVTAVLVALRSLGAAGA
jgi:hypothetical protein